MSSRAVWSPTKELIESSRLFNLMKKLNITNYDDFYKRSIQDIAWFWGEVEKDLGISWFKPYDKVLDLSKGMKWPRWYVGGELNVTHNALDKWVADPDVKDRTAIIWEGEDGETRKYSYEELAEQVNRFANGLIKQGIQKGDRIAIYMPMIAEAAVSMLAISKIGAVYMPVFSGYAADAVAKRLNDAEAKMLITADGCYRRGKEINMKQEADKAVSNSTVKKVVVVSRLKKEVAWNKDIDITWEEMITDNKPVATESMKSNDPFLLIYTSGTTGKPKGIVHTHAGFPIKAASDAAYGFELHPCEVLFWYSDMGWTMGPILVLSALLNASTMVLYEGSPDYPSPGRLWQLVEDHRITHFGISPTLIRSLMQYEDKWYSDCDLSSLRVFGSTGESWNSEPWNWLFKKIGKERVPIFNYSGGTEVSGGILANTLLKPIAPVGFNSRMLGMDAEIYDANGKFVQGEVGELVIKQPWVGMTNGFWRDSARYEKAYWNNDWPDTWIHGDWVEVDNEGFLYVTGRSDDTLNVAGKRMGPTEMESVLVEHSCVAEAATIGVPDPLKGVAAVCFVVLNPNEEAKQELEKQLHNLIRERLGKALQPKVIHFVEKLPKTKNAKVMRRVIRSAYLNLDMGDLSSLENPEAVEEILQCRKQKI
ncbi:AMP-binding protein [Anaerobacillus sp. MEB173]|uniref:AMP-binding protein n=1 Tax=Anaerobacillus sp. MEB173 TaxID=3383345 RepID=UPI003F92B361